MTVSPPLGYVGQHSQPSGICFFPQTLRALPGQHWGHRRTCMPSCYHRSGRGDPERVLWTVPSSGQSPGLQKRGCHTVHFKACFWSFQVSCLGQASYILPQFSHLWSGDKIVSRGPGERVSGRSPYTGLILGWGSLWASKPRLWLAVFTRHSALEPGAF